MKLYLKLLVIACLYISANLMAETTLETEFNNSLERLLLDRSTFLFQEQIDEQKLLDFGGRFHEGSIIDCGIRTVEFCYRAREEKVASLYLRDNYSIEQIIKITLAAEEVAGITVNCKGFSPEQCMSFSHRELGIEIDKTVGYSYESLSKIARSTFFPQKVFISCEGLDFEECLELAKWDVHLELSDSYTKKQVRKLLTFSDMPSRVYVPWKNNIDDGLEIALRGGNFSVHQSSLDINAFKKVLSRGEDLKFRAYLNSKEVSEFTKISNFWPGDFRWLN